MITISIRFKFSVRIYHSDKSPQKVCHKSSSVPNLIQTVKAEMEKQNETTSRSTQANYQTAINSLQQFLGTDVPVNHLNADLIRGYEKWLRDRHINPNTISCYMRSLRSLLVKALRSYDIHVEQTFRNVFTGRTVTSKRSLEPAVINKLKNAVLTTNTSLQLTRDIFLFCFYALGMPFVDIAFLRRQQVSDGQIIYYRHKTGTRIVVPLQPCMQEIINRYASSDSEYVFPLLSSVDPTEAYDQYLTQLNWYNRSLKRLAKATGINEKLTSYHARHSWATSAYHSNVELPVISRALGHRSPQTTLTYIREIDDNRLEEATRQVVNLLY